MKPRTVQAVVREMENSRPNRRKIVTVAPEPIVFQNADRVVFRGGGVGGADCPIPTEARMLDV